MSVDKATVPDLERGRQPSSLSHWRTLVDQGITTPEIENWKYAGTGTEKDPYVVIWIENDPRNPMSFKSKYKWMLTLTMAFSVLSVSLNASTFSGGLQEIRQNFKISEEVSILGLSLFVIGFAVGPLFWAPLSEMYGRQILFFLTFGCFSFFNAGAAGSQNIWTILILRFFAGSFGSSPLTNAGGVIADCFPARQRGLATSIFAAAPFLGPALGPIIGGFLGESAGWRWVMGFMAVTSGVGWILGTLLVPETYAPVLLRRRAERLTKLTGKIYRSRLDIDRGELSVADAFKTALSRPWILLIREPIVLILSIYMAIVYGTLFMLFAAYPIVYQEGRQWSQGIGGLAFLGVMIGMVFAVVYCIFIENPRYQKVVDEKGGFANPEDRLPPSILGGVLLPIGLFWFAWTNSPALPWAASMAAGIPFGFGMVLVFLSIMNYLIDSYTIFAASVLAANSVLRSTFGAAFPLFTTQMYQKLGIHWASSIPAFLALACIPFPFLLYKYGEAIRLRCRYAAEADEFMRKLRGEAEPNESTTGHSASGDDLCEIGDRDAEESRDARASADAESAADSEPRFERIRTGYSARTVHSMREYDENPFDIDRVNTQKSFPGNGSRESPNLANAPGQEN